MDSDFSSTAMGSYWCYRCSRVIRAWVNPDEPACPYCFSGFIEEMEISPSSATHRSPFPAHTTAMLADGAHDLYSNDRRRLSATRRRRRHAVDHSSFNPVIVFRGPVDLGSVEGSEEGDRSSFDLYYDDGDGTGLRPLPAPVSEFLMGSGFDRLLEQLSQIEVNGLGRAEHPPASKAAIESMPTIEIAGTHVCSDAHCAICTEAFEVGSEAREMPCKHIYHSDCILPWLSLRNSCPVCRHELSADGILMENPIIGQTRTGAEEEAMGLTIWRLPGGGFAVGRFSSGGRAGERELPAVYTEMDGGFNSSGAPRRVSWASRSSRVREGRGIGRIFRNFFSFMRRLRPSSASSSSSNSSSEFRSMSRSYSHANSAFNRMGSSRRRTRTWVLDD